MNKTEVKVELEEKKFPVRWVRCKLGNVIEKIEDGGTPPREDPTNFNGGIPWVVIDDIKKRIFSTKDTLSKKGLKICNAKLWKKGSIILSFGATIGKVGITEVDLSTKQGIAGIEVKSDEIYNEFLYYMLLIKKNELLRYSNGTTIKEIRPETIKEKIKLLFPSSLPEQQKIVEILEAVDETIEKTDAIIEKYKRIKQGLMQELLTRGIDEKGQIRSEEAHKFKDSPLGRIPEEWEVVKVKDIGEIEGGYAFKSDSFLLDGEYQVIKMGNLYKEILDLKKNLAFLNTLNEQEEKYTLKHLEILITLTGTIGKKDYGYTVILKHPKKVVFNQRVARIRVIKTQNNPIFIFYQIKMEFFLKQFFDNSKGGTGNQTNVSIYDLKKIKILRPPLLEQEHIASILSQIGETIEKEQKYKEKLERLKQGLMEDLLTGRVRVNHLIKEGVESV